MVKKRSVGGIVFKVEQGRVFWLVGRHSGYHKWIFPKGKVEEGEDDLEGVKREIKEETGVIADPVSEDSIFEYQYFFSEPLPQGKKGKIYKTVAFYLLEFQSGDLSKHDLEMSRVCWFSYERALKTLAFPKEKEALEKAQCLLRAWKLV